MGNSRSESPRPGSFVLLPSLQGVEGDGVISKDSPRGKEQGLARAEERPVFVIARSTATKQSQNGQPEMRQA